MLISVAVAAEAKLGSHDAAGSKTVCFLWLECAPCDVTQD